ncbi:hypothetical protein AVEN_60102-1 [Araneus ventricosus]|uniref:Uncharacterized protein n=1 Tax=Araneus ventricosus TaxID=182803 RepID=A0A4Y2J805_ARAVE|nr:hypothetical protein AVEN_60102-1 [Araneus ventricosus]
MLFPPRTPKFQEDDTQVWEINCQQRNEPLFSSKTHSGFRNRLIPVSVEWGGLRRIGLMGLNHDQMTRPELTPPSPKFCSTPVGGCLNHAVRFNLHQVHIHGGSSVESGSEPSTEAETFPLGHRGFKTCRI